MSKIIYFILVQAFALALLIIAIILFAHQHYRYQKIKRLYRADYAKDSYLKSISRLLPLMPDCKSTRYRNTVGLIVDSGLRISVENFYLIKTALFILGFTFFISIQTTNTFILYEGIINDLNIEKTLLDISVKPDTEIVKLENEIFSYTETCLSREKVSFAELKNKQNSQMYIEYLEAQISDKWPDLNENAYDTAKRMYKKLIRIRTIETDYARYFTALVAAIILYFMPNIIGHIKLKLIEDKRDWEILNYIYVFSIFGRMPPFNIKNVLSNILAISDIYKPIINEVLNNIKSGKGRRLSTVCCKGWRTRSFMNSWSLCDFL